MLVHLSLGHNQEELTGNGERVWDDLVQLFEHNMCQGETSGVSVFIKQISEETEQE